MKKVVIVGGGSAGWMSAAFLSKVLGNQVDITLIESDSIQTVGVGEATIPPIQLFNKLLGINEAKFMSATQATIKLAIQFENWGKLGDNYQHAFGPTGTQVGLTPFLQYWLRAKSCGNTSHLGEYSFNAVAASHGKFAHQKQPASPGNPTLAYAYHFDAMAYAHLLRDISISQGVKRRVATVKQVHINSTCGDIEALSLEDGERLTGDLFIDCSGMRSLLLGQALEVPFESWQHWLPCDRAIAIQSDAVLSTPYTRAIAHAAGWQWQIPLRSRTGNGLVYSSSHYSDAEALMLLQANLPGKATTEPNYIRFAVGRRTQQWKNNCIAIGMASGFLEPLESTSLHMVQSSLIRLVKLFPRADIQPYNVAEFNRLAKLEAEDIRDFIILHYQQNQRTDSQFWKDCNTTPLPPTLQERLNTFGASGYLARRNDELFDENAWTQVLIGQGNIPTNYHPLADDLPAPNLEKFLTSLTLQTQKFSATLPDHLEYLRHYCDQKELKSYA